MLKLILLCFSIFSLACTKSKNPPDFHDFSSDHPPTSAILRIKVGEGSAQDHAQVSKFVKSKAQLVDKAVAKLSGLTFEQIWLYCDKTFDVDALRKKVRSCARKILELISPEIERCRPLHSIYPYKDLIAKMRYQRALIETADSNCPEYLTSTYKAKIHTQDFLDQAKKKLIKAFNEYNAAQPQGGEALVVALKGLTRATLMLKMAIHPERTFTQKTKTQIERIVNSAEKFFSVLAA